MGYPELYVLRHGETTWNAEGRMQGRLNSPLTAAGLAQAARQAEILADVDLTGFDVISSPQGRAFQTAGIAVAAQVARLRTDEDLREIEVGDWSGLLRANLTVPGVVLEDTPDGPLALYEHAPGGEGFANLRRRMTGFLAGLQGPSVLITHGITSRMLRAIVLGQPTSALGDLPGGQGVVFHIRDGVQKRLT